MRNSDSLLQSGIFERDPGSRAPKVRLESPERRRCRTENDLEMNMEFDTYTVALLEEQPGGPKFTDEEENSLQDAHMDHLANLHEAGQLQAAGPIVTPPVRTLRGVSLHALPLDEVEKLYTNDPWVRAGRLKVRLFTWLVPKGTIAFSDSKFPHSQSEL